MMTVTRSPGGAQPPAARSSLSCSEARRLPGCRVEIFETPDGNRFLEYVLHPVDDPKRPIARTRDPFWVRKIITNRDEEPFILKISPKAPNAFEGNTITFTASHNAPGTDKKTTWSWGESGGPSGSEETETISRTLNKAALSVGCTKEVSLPLENGEESVITLMGYHTMYPLWPKSLFPSDFAILDPSGKGTATFEAARWLVIGSETMETLQFPLIEGEVHPMGQGGTLTVKKAVLRIAAGSGATISNPTALAQKLTFTEPGLCEIVHDVEMDYQFEGERYSAAFKPNDCMLAGAFKTTARMGFSRIPPGIILATSRKVMVDFIDLTVDGNTHRYSLSDQPDWEIARSSQFPEHPPIRISGIQPGFMEPIEQFFPDYHPAVFYADEGQLVGDEAEFKPVVKPLFNCQPSPETVFPTVNTLKIRAYDLDTEFLTAEIKPSPLPTLYEGQNLIVDGAIVPVSELGSGRIDANGGTIDILQGYEMESVSMMHWEHWVHEEAPPERVQDVAWSYDFKPKDGSGTYTVYAVAGVKVKESETGDTVTVYGSGNEQVLVKPGLRILSPLARVVYPQGAAISVSTTYDKDTTNWKKIQWTLNGKPWSPEGDEGPA